MGADVSSTRRWWHTVGRALGAAVVPLYVTGMGTATILQTRTPGVQRDGLEDLVLVTGFLGFAVVGAVLLRRRPDNAVSWLMASVPLLLGLAIPAEAWAGYVMTVNGRPDALAVIGAWLNSWYWFALLAVVFAGVPLLFPTGRLPTRRWRAAAVLPVIATMGMVLTAAVAERLPGQDVEYVIDNPLGIAGVPSLEDNPLFDLFSVLLITGCAIGLGAMAVRFSRARIVERQQLKWVIVAAALFPLALAFEEVAPALTSVLFSVALIGLPLAIAVAILRYRLYEIDRIISRTVTYGLVTAVLVGVYALVAVVPAALFDLQSDLLVAGATLVAAAAFGPVRRRVQRLVDRRFNRTRYDAAQVADAFAARLRDEVDLTDLTDDLRGVVATTVQPAHLSLWLRQAEVDP